MSHTTQRDRLRALFEANLGNPIPLPEILSLGIAQYGARILELRREGNDIRSTVEDVVDGRKHTTFTYYGRKPEPIHSDGCEPSAPSVLSDYARHTCELEAKSAPLFAEVRR